MDSLLSYAFVLLFLGICHANQNEKPSDCNLPAEGGICYAYFPMFFHNASTGKCEQFIYGGCGGNANRFWTEKECMDRCGGGEAEAQENGKTAKVLSVPDADICNQDKETGNCSSQINRYYFNRDSRKCETFRYSGCGKSANNFNYIFECERACPGDLELGDICVLEMKQGPCRAFFRRYYFNKEAGQCEEFIFGGCQGNHNNFQTKEECESYCPPGSSHTT